MSSRCQLTHHSLSRNKSMRGIKSVAIQLDSSLAAARLEEAELLASGAPKSMIS